MSGDGLTAQETRFLNHYFDPANAETFMNATRSGLAAKLGGTVKSAAVAGSQLLRKPNVLAEARKRLQKGEQEFDDVLKRLWARALVDPIEVFDDQIVRKRRRLLLRRLDEMPPEARWSIKKIWVGPKSIEVELHDALPAIRLIAQLQGRLSPDVAQVNQTFINQQVNAVTITLRHLPSDKLEQAERHLAALEELGVLPKAEPLGVARLTPPRLPP